MQLTALLTNHSLVGSISRIIVVTMRDAADSLGDIAHLAYRELIQVQPDPAWQNGSVFALLGSAREF